VLAEVGIVRAEAPVHFDVHNVFKR
jgi:hypothetical protein